MLDCLRATETKFSACELASIATGATQRARRSRKSMNGAPLLRPRGRRPGRAPRPRWGRSGGAGADSGVISRPRRDNGVALVCLTLLQMVSRPPPLFSFSSPAFKPLPSSSFPFHLLSLFAFLLCHSGKRLQHCRGGCSAGAEDFFFFLICVIVRAGPSPWIHAHVQIYNTARHKMFAPNQKGGLRGWNAHGPVAS